MDIVNGFIREGAMASARIEDIIKPNARLLSACSHAGILTAAFADCHKENAAEFLSFPPHCIENTSESEVVDELKAAGDYILIPKNSTNGFHEKKFREPAGVPPRDRYIYRHRRLHRYLRYAVLPEP